MAISNKGIHRVPIRKRRGWDSLLTTYFFAALLRRFGFAFSS